MSGVAVLITVVNGVFHSVFRCESWADAIEVAKRQGQAFPELVDLAAQDQQLRLPPRQYANSNGSFRCYIRVPREFSEEALPK